MKNGEDELKEHKTIVQQLNETIETMKNSHKEQHDKKDALHAGKVANLKTWHLGKLRSQREDREQREANNRAYITKIK